MAKSIDVRKDMPTRKLDESEFKERYQSAFRDPAFDPLHKELDYITTATWDAYANGRKSPHTKPAGSGFADPGYEIATDWLQAKAAIDEAQKRYNDKTRTPRILLINGSSCTEHTCPGEMSKTWRLTEIAKTTIEKMGDIEVDVLDLSRTISEYGKIIHPCKSCVSTSMALCHWPCSCYPNYSLGQSHDWMNEIYPHFPVHWYQAPAPLKAMIDRLVCADGSNPAPSSTHGKKAEEAKKLELDNWPYPRHLAGCLFGAVVHGEPNNRDYSPY